MLYSILISSLWILGVNCRIQYDFSKRGEIGHDLSISNELRESLSVGWYGDIKYSSDEYTTLGSSDNAEADNGDGGTTDGGDPEPGTSSGGATSGTEGTDIKSGLFFFVFILNLLKLILNAMTCLDAMKLQKNTNKKKQNKMRLTKIEQELIVTNCKLYL